jgi:DNA-directed RNA polymerase subunit RPC12/RpoP
MLYENDTNDVFLCQNCDAEFFVTKIDDEIADVCFCPYCGEVVVDVDDDDDEDEDD